MKKTLECIKDLLESIVSFFKGVWHLLSDPLDFFKKLFLSICHYSIPACTLIAVVAILFYICGSKKGGKYIYWSIMICLILNALGVAINAI
jgi:hypothetical protein